MKIVKPYMKMIAPASWIDFAGGQFHIGKFETRDGFDLLRMVEWAGRVSHRTEDAVSEESYKRFIKTVVLDHGDWSITEHATVSVDALVDRGITHEIVRHRIAAYTQESTRFVNYEKKMPPSFIYPIPEVECHLCLLGIEPLEYHGEGVDWGFRHENSECLYDKHWRYSVDMAERSYRKLLAKGWRPQEARSVFPNALASRIVMTYNLRTWRHFFLMRTSKEAHPQMRQVTIPLLKEFQEKIPILYDDIEPEARQVDNLKKGR